jgi:3-dehydroquinate dehydratase/shikimate dehydrogenase
MAGTARVCLCLTAPTLRRDQELAARYCRAADLLELRADFLLASELASLARFPEQAGLPVILTLRRTSDGGRWSGSEGERRRVLQKALAGAGRPYACVDLEDDLRDAGLERTARERGTRVIRSLHVLSGVPRNLAERIRRLARSPDALPKAAVQVRGTRDLLRLVRAYHALAGQEKILLGLGEHGLPSLVLAGRLGSWLTCCLPGESLPAAATGQIAIETLLELYRFRGIDRETGLFGVIGDPIAHSRSPELHNRGYAALGLNAVYLPFLVDRLGPFLKAAELLGLRGLSVTAPFKQKVIRRLAEADEAVRAIGACNTLLRSGERWKGANTDAEGFLQPLERQAPGLLHPGAGAAVIGAGGAARAVVYALRQRGLRVLVLNRTPARARALARRFGCQWGALDRSGLDRLGPSRALLVQATTAGLHGRGDPLGEYAFRGDELVYELIYSPALTPLLARAQAAGCRTIGGMSMLQAQGRAQFRLFTGRDYPDDLAAASGASG